MSLPLEGIKVIDWSAWQQGPVAAMMLGDLGADIIKIEDPEGGDAGRGVMRISGQMTGVYGRNYYFENQNRNKRSITLNLKHPRARNILYRMIEKSDVFVHNFRREPAERLKLDYRTLSKYNPKLVYATGSGWGPQGPVFDKPSFDYTAMAMSGFMTIIGEPEMPPLPANIGIADQMGATMLAYGILAALIARDRLGIGQEIDCSLLGSMLWLQNQQIAAKTITGYEMKRPSRKSAGNPLWNHYQCSDGKWLALANPHADIKWPALCRILAITELEKDPRFVDLDTRAENSAEIISILDDAFAGKNRDDWLLLLEEEGIICAPLNTISDIVVHPQVLANDYITDFDHPVWGKVKIAGCPVVFSETPAGPQKEAPELGQHTEEILLEMGYDWDEINSYKDMRVI